MPFIFQQSLCFIIYTTINHKRGNHLVVGPNVRMQVWVASLFSSLFIEAFFNASIEYSLPMTKKSIGIHCKPQVRNKSNKRITLGITWQYNIWSHHECNTFFKNHHAYYYTTINHKCGNHLVVGRNVRMQGWVAFFFSSLFIEAFYQHWMQFAYDWTINRYSLQITGTQQERQT